VKKELAKRRKQENADPPVLRKAPAAQLNFQHTVVVDTTATAA
jgi:hypothetical protein